MNHADDADPAMRQHEGPTSFAEELEAIDMPETMAAQVIALHDRYLKRDALHHASFAVMQIIDRVRDVGYLPALLCYELGIVTAQNPAEIAERFGVSKQAVHQLQKRLASKLASKGLHKVISLKAEPTAPIRPGRGFVNVREAARLARMPINEIKRLKADGVFTIKTGLDGMSQWLMRDEVRKIARRWAIAQAQAKGSRHRAWPRAQGTPVPLFYKEQE